MARQLRHVVRRKIPENEELQLFSPSQCSSTLVGFVQGFENLKTMEDPLHSPDLAPVKFYQFSRLKSALKGRPFSDATDIIKNATEELKRLSRNGSQDYFAQLYIGW